MGAANFVQLYQSRRRAGKYQTLKVRSEYEKEREGEVQKALKVQYKLKTGNKYKSKLEKKTSVAAIKPQTMSILFMRQVAQRSSVVFTEKNAPFLKQPF